MVCGLFDSGWNFGIGFLKIENERTPARAFGGGCPKCVESVFAYACHFKISCKKFVKIFDVAVFGFVFLAGD